MIFEPITAQNKKAWKTWVSINIKTASDMSIIASHYLQQCGLQETLEFLGEFKFNDDMRDVIRKTCLSYVVTHQFDVSLFDNISPSDINYFLDFDVFNTAPDVLYEKAMISRISESTAIRYYMRSPEHAKRMLKEYPELKMNAIVKSMSIDADNLSTHTASQLLKDCLSSKKSSSELVEFAKNKKQFKTLVEVFNQEHLDVFHKDQRRHSYVNSQLQKVLGKLLKNKPELISAYYKNLPQAPHISSLIIRHQDAIPVIQRVYSESLDAIAETAHIMGADILHLPSLKKPTSKNVLRNKNDVKFYGSIKSRYDLMDIIAPQNPEYPFYAILGQNDELFNMSFLILITHLDEPEFWDYATIFEDSSKIQQLKKLLKPDLGYVTELIKDVTKEVGKKRMAKIKKQTRYEDITQPLVSFMTLFDTNVTNPSLRIYRDDVRPYVIQTGANAEKGYTEYLNFIRQNPADLDFLEEEFNILS